MKEEALGLTWDPNNAGASGERAFPDGYRLLDPARIDVSLSEEFQLEPEQSTSAIIVHHEEAKYFSID